MGELPTYRVAVRARKEPAGTYTYVITRIDDPNWAERTGESYSTPEAASEAGWIALDRIRVEAHGKLPSEAPLSGRKAMEWFSQKTSIAGIQISNWMLVLGAIIVIWIIYSFISH